MDKFKPLEEKIDFDQRVGRIKDRPDLFETKLLRIEGGQKEGSKNILVCSRDPGSAAAIIPVVERVAKNSNCYFLTDGRAKEAISKNFETEDISPKESVLLAGDVIPEPDLILVDPSSSEMGLENYAAADFSDTPMVLVEDYYAMANLALERFKNIKHMPVKICVMDQAAKDIIVEKYPEAEKTIEITGQPSFDEIAKEDIPKIYQEVREKLKLKQEDALISFFAIATDQRQMVRQIIKQLTNIKGRKIFFALRNHPRSLFNDSEYEAIIQKSGGDALDTRNFTSGQISAASDLIITTTSTEGLRGIYRRKPTIHILDNQYGGQAEEFSANYVPPPCQLGASELVENIDTMSQRISELLDPTSEASRNLQENIRKHCQLDGQSTERVVKIVEDVLNKK